MARILVIENLPDGADAEWVQDELRRMLGDDIEIQQIAIEETRAGSPARFLLPIRRMAHAGIVIPLRAQGRSWLRKWCTAVVIQCRTYKRYLACNSQAAHAP